MVGKPATQRGSQVSGSQQPKPRSRTRNTTPERPLIQNSESRDELARTMSQHNGRRRKRSLDESDAEEVNDASPCSSPAKAKKSSTQAMPQASKYSRTKPPTAATQPMPGASKTPRTKPPTAATQPMPEASKPPRTKPPTAATQPMPQASKTPHTKPATAATKPPTIKPTNTTLKVSAGNARHAVSVGDDETLDGEERSRSNSTATLMPGSNSQSQTNGHDAVVSQFSTMKRRTKDPTHSSKSEAEAFSQLNLLTRRYFLTFLSNTYADEPVRAIFPGMRSDHQVYREAKYRVQRSYKTWKGEVLKWALQWIQRWIKSATGLKRQALRSELSTFAGIKAEVRKEYDSKWLESVFRFGIEAVDFEAITEDGLRFLKYAFLQLVTHSRLTELHLEDPINPLLAKYTRKHLLDLFDALHQKSGFEHQSLDFYPERIIPRSVQYKKRPKVDINQDSDATTGESDVDVGEDQVSDVDGDEEDGEMVSDGGEDGNSGW